MSRAWVDGGAASAHVAAMHSTDLPRPTWPALARGFGLTCPQCGTGRLYGRFLKVNPSCGSCGAELHHHRADDAPPYFTIVIIGHLVVPGMLLLEQLVAPPTWVQVALWVPTIVVGALWLLPRVKGALIGFQWAHRMHGFGGEVD